MNKNLENFWVGFDLGGTKMLATVFNHKFQCQGRSRKKTRGNEGAEAGVQRIIETIRSALEEADVQISQLGGIGIGCPGPLDLDNGILVDAPNLGWSNVELKRILETEFDCAAVISNDVDAGVYGEYRFGAGKNARCVLGVFPGTGIGGGCIYNGTIMRGQIHSCMEIGHINVIPNGPRCGCGRNGCLEAVASRMAISAAAAQAAYRGDAPHLLKLAGTDLSNIRSGALAESVQQGDQEVELILRHAARHIGLAIGSVINLLAPDVIVLGGGLVEALPNLFLEEIRDSAKETGLDGLIHSVNVHTAELGDDAAVMGAASWAREIVEQKS